MSTIEFKIDPGFATLCKQFGRFNHSHVLLMDNADIPWFILIPETQEVELYELEVAVHNQIFDEIRAMSLFVKRHFKVDKLNVACNGNVIRQMHLHVIGRRFDDYCWPATVWGIEPPSLYDDIEVSRIRSLLKDDETLAVAGYQSE